MEKQDRREQVRDGAIGSSFARHALILNPSSSHCATNRCDSLLALLQHSSFFAEIQAISGDYQPAAISFAPDIVFLRVPIERGHHKLFESCKIQWNRAAILAVVCPGFSHPAHENSVDSELGG